MTELALKTEELATETPVAVYNPMRQQLAEIKDHNAKLVFDYTDPKGNKEARSHVYKLRQTKAAIEKARKAEKAASLEYGRKVDAEANVLLDEVEQMIDVHQKPLDEQEQKEKLRVDGITKALSAIPITAEFVIDKTSDQLRDRLEELQALDIENNPAYWGEFIALAVSSRINAVEYLTGAMAIALKRETEAAELQKLREEAEARRVEDERRIAADKAAQDEKDRLAREAEEKKIREDEARRVEAERIEREKKLAAEAAETERQRVEAEGKERERLLREQAEKSQREAKEAEERRVREAAEAEERQKKAVQDEKDRQQREADTKAADDARREADKEHRRKIHRAIVDAMLAIGQTPVTEAQAQAIVIGICGDAIPHMKIIY